jgi:hypothetical protein
MRTRREREGLRRRLLAASVFAALLAQMALPALHALREDSALGASPALQVASAATAAEAGILHSAPAHDPADCPVCRILMRTTPVATPPATSAELRTDCPPAAPELAPRTDFAVVLLGHPPRAPPA